MPKNQHCTLLYFKKKTVDGMGRCCAVKPGGIAPERRLEETH